MLGLTSAPSLTSSPGLTGAGGPMVRAPRRCNVSCVRRFHPYAAEYFDQCDALSGGRTGITSSAHIEERYNLDRFVRGYVDTADWSRLISWTLKGGQSVGSGITVPSLGGFGAFNATLENGPTWVGSSINTSTNNQRAICALTDPLTESPFTYIGVLRQNGTSANTRCYMADTNGTGGKVIQSYPTAGATGVRAISTGGGATLAGNTIGFVSWVIPSAINARISVNGGFVDQSGPGNWDTATVASNFFSIFNHVYFGGNLDTINHFFYAAVVGSALLDVQVLALRALYKSTIGPGLGLP